MAQQILAGDDALRQRHRPCAILVGQTLAGPRHTLRRVVARLVDLEPHVASVAGKILTTGGATIGPSSRQ